MGIFLNTSRNDEVVSFDYQKYLVGVLHKCLGTNSEHDSISLYSFELKHSLALSDTFLFTPF